MSALWQAWRAHEGTALVVSGLKERRAAFVESLATGVFTYKTCEATALKTAEVVGRINEIDQLIELMMTDEDADDKQVSDFEDHQT
jgi:hypothetical protein